MEVSAAALEVRSGAAPVISREGSEGDSANIRQSLNPLANKPFWLVQTRAAKPHSSAYFIL